MGTQSSSSSSIRIAANRSSFTWPHMQITHRWSSTGWPEKCSTPNGQTHMHRRGAATGRVEQQQLGTQALTVEWSTFLAAPPASSTATAAAAASTTIITHLPALDIKIRQRRKKKKNSVSGGIRQKDRHTDRHQAAKRCFSRHTGQSEQKPNKNVQNNVQNYQKSFIKLPKRAQRAT